MPLALRENVEHNNVVHQAAVVVTVETLEVAYVHPDDRVVVDDLGYRDDGIMHVSVRYGFQDEHNVPDALRQAAEQGLESEIDVDKASYFVSRITIVRGDAPGGRHGVPEGPAPGSPCPRRWSSRHCPRS